MLKVGQKLYTFSVRKIHFNSIGVIGVPFSKGQPKGGVAGGPKAIRDAGLIGRIADIHPDIKVKDYGNLSYKPEDIQELPNMKHFANVAACNYELSKKVEQIISDGNMCLTLGGDHSIGIGTVDGHIKAKNEKVSILWVDAHADLNTNKTSASGNVHGMPLAILVKELADYWSYLPGMDWQKPVISLRNVAYIGLRSIDSYERLIIEQFGINAFGMEDVENFGVSSVVQMALARIDPHQDRSIHLSFDIDSLDSLEAPSTGTSVRGGLTLREGIQLVEEVYKTNRLSAMDLVEVNPALGTGRDSEKTVGAAIEVILAGCGYNRKGLVPRSSQIPI